MSGMERLTTSYNASLGLCAAFNGETDCDLRPGHLEQGIPHRLRSPSDSRWQAYDDDGNVVGQGGGTRYAIGTKWSQTWVEYLDSLHRSTRLAEFLLERITEDETVARAAAWGEEKFLAWELGEQYATLQVQTVATEGTSPEYAQHIAITCDSEGLSDSVVTREAGAHIARFDPARVVARCKADRRIVNAWRSGQPDEDRYAIGWHDAHLNILCVMAAEYVDHPDFRPEWAL